MYYVETETRTDDTKDSFSDRSIQNLKIRVTKYLGIIVHDKLDDEEDIMRHVKYVN